MDERERARREIETCERRDKERRGGQRERRKRERERERTKERERHRESERERERERATETDMCAHVNPKNIISKYYSRCWLSRHCLNCEGYPCTIKLQPSRCHAETPQRGERERGRYEKRNKTKTERQNRDTDREREK